MDVNVKVEQEGGKYGSFKCPVCGGLAMYKFSAASGACHDCDSMFVYTGAADLIDAEKGKFSTHWISLEIAS